MKKIFYLLLTVCLTCGTSCAKNFGDDSSDPGVPGGFRLHSMLQDGMVIQQNQPFRVWGISPAGVKVSVGATWTTEKYSTVTPQNGRWTIDIPVPAAARNGMRHTLTVSTSLQTQTLSDLLIGEVWVLGGQSNMTFGMEQVLDAATEIAAANYHEIRYFTVMSNMAAAPMYDWRDDAPAAYYRWTAVSPTTVAPLSAVGYYFALMLYKQLGVPVGVINTATGGATAQAYTPYNALESDPALKQTFIDPYEQDPNMGMLVRPAGLYNGMVAPLLPFSTRGFTWYQGEGNWGGYEIYPLLMKTLITTWRENFNRGELPFYYVQIAPWAMGLEQNSASFYHQHPSYFFIREAQSMTRDQVPSTGMVVTMDVGDPSDIHPINKKPVGERLARLALNQTYSCADVNCLGPRYKSHKVEDGVVKIAFDHAEGLTTNDSQAPKYFYVSGSKGAPYLFYPTMAKINGSEVWLTCPKVVTSTTQAADIQIRYAYLMYSVTNVQNGDGLPMEPFRTDSWSWAFGAPADVRYVY